MDLIGTTFIVILFAEGVHSVLIPGEFQPCSSPSECSPTPACCTRDAGLYPAEVKLGADASLLLSTHLVAGNPPALASSPQTG